MTIRKIISVLVFSLMALIYLPAHANMDFAMGMATGVPTGSSMSMLGAQIHNSMDDDSETVQAPQQGSHQAVQTKESGSQTFIRFLKALLITCVIMFALKLIFKIS